MRYFAVLLVAACLCGGETLRRAPGFSLPDTKLEQHDLMDYRGRIVLLDFMRTDCPHCQSLSGVLEAVKKKYGDKLAVLSVVMPPDTVASVQMYSVKHKVTGPFLFDCSQVAASYMRPTPNNPSVTLPHLYLIDRAGMIRKDFDYRPDTAKFFEGRALFTEIDELLNQK